MAAKSIVPELLPLLEAYIEARIAEWEAQAADPRIPTLPSTKEGKINVRELALALGLKRSQEQQFFKHVELRAAVNAAAATQGLAQISSREESDASDAALGKRIAKTGAVLSDLQRVCAEQAAQIEVMRSRMASLEERLRLRDETGMVFRGGL